jgi:hypothetical protein
LITKPRSQGLILCHQNLVDGAQPLHGSAKVRDLLAQLAPTLARLAELLVLGITLRTAVAALFHADSFRDGGVVVMDQRR